MIINKQCEIILYNKNIANASSVISIWIISFQPKTNNLQLTIKWGNSFDLALNTSRPTWLNKGPTSSPNRSKYPCTSWPKDRPKGCGSHATGPGPAVPWQAGNYVWNSLARVNMAGGEIQRSVYTRACCNNAHAGQTSWPRPTTGLLSGYAYARPESKRAYIIRLHLSAPASALVECYSCY